MLFLIFLFCFLVFFYFLKSDKKKNIVKGNETDFKVPVYLVFYHLWNSPSMQFPQMQTPRMCLWDNAQEIDFCYIIQHIRFYIFIIIIG